MTTRKISRLSVALLTCMVALSACSTNDRASTLPPGTYKSSTTSTNANGTTVDKDTTTNVSVDANGNKVVDTKSKASVDPKGLFNKRSATTEDVKTYPNQ